MKKGKETQNEKKSAKISGLITHESIGAVGCIFTLFAFLILVTGRAIFGDLGYAIKSFLLGVFGYFSYLALPALFCASVAAFLGKRFFRTKSVFLCMATISLGFLIVHTATTYSWSNKGYLYACFSVAAGGAKEATVAGWIGALPIFLLRKFTGRVGAIVILSLCLLLFAALTVRFVFGISLFKGFSRKDKSEQVSETPAEQVVPTQTADPVYGARYPQGQQPVYPYPQAGQTDYNSPMQGYPGERQNGYYSERPTRPEYIPVTPDLRQRPGVLLSDTPASTQAPTGATGAFSPFGYPTGEQAQSTQNANAPSSGREFLFGGDPAENYRKNLIFDSNANVNRKPAADPEQPAFGGNFNPSGSYTSAYANSVNSDPEPVRPEKIVTDQPFGTGFARSQQEETPPVRYGFETEQRTLYEEPVQPSVPQSEREAWRIDPPTEDRTERYTVQPTEEVATTRDEFGTGTRYQPPLFDEPFVEPVREEPQRETPDYRSIFSPSNPNLFGGEEKEEDDLFSDSTDVSSAFEEETSRDSFGRRESALSEDTPRRDRGRVDLNIFDEPTAQDEPVRGREDIARDRSENEPFRGERGGLTRGENRGLETDREPSVARRVEPPAPQPPAPKPKPKVLRPYQTAPIHFFDCRDVEPDANTAEVEENKRTILETLSGFKVTDATIASVTYGPTVTRYNVAIPRNISPKKVVSLDQEIAISLYAANGVNIYPNFEEGAVSIEVPNKRRQFVQLGCMLTGEGYVNCKSTSLTFTMGKDVGNRKVYGDIRKMTHLLVAGASGSGKSVFLRCLIISLIVKYSPSDLRLILIDPKKTEFVIYDHLPHLVINEIITETPKVIQSLNWAIGEMNRRYSLFEKKSRSGTYVVNIDEYNANLQDGEEKLPKIVIIVDELADLMLAAQKDIEDRIQNLTQKSRAAGIHMILATQRPSADVITGVIKSNLKTRIAFSVTAEVDSRVILDATGAHKLLGKGDMLYTMEGIATPIRVQSPSIESEDAQKVVNYIKANNDTDFDEEAAAYINNTRASSDPTEVNGGEEVEPVYIEAVRYIILSGSASISMIQRKCSVGYNKAGKIIEWMEEMGYISAFDGAKARKVLITEEEFEAQYGPLT